MKLITSPFIYMTRFLLACTALLAMNLSAADANLNKDNVAISGYDPVSYFSNQPQEGNKNITSNYGNATYYFHSEENKDAFLANPDKYVPAYGGWCAWAMLEGDKVKVDPLTYKIIDGKNYLYYNGFWGNTLAKWNEKGEKTPEIELVKAADIHWSKL